MSRTCRAGSCSSGNPDLGTCVGTGHGGHQLLLLVTERDWWEISACDRDFPLLGICSGQSCWYLGIPGDPKLSWLMKKIVCLVACPSFSCICYAQNLKSFCQATLSRFLLIYLGIWLTVNIFPFPYLLFLLNRIPGDTEFKETAGDLTADVAPLFHLPSLPGSVQTFSFSLSCRWRSLSSSNPAEPSVHTSSAVLGPQGQLGEVWLTELFPSLHLKFSLGWEDSPTQQHLHYYQLAEMGREGAALLRWICRHSALSLWINWVWRWCRWFSCIHQRKVIEHSVNLMGISYKEWYLQEGKP